MKNILFIASDNSSISGAFLCMVKLCELLKSNYDCNVSVVLPGDGDGNHLLDEIGIQSYTVKSCTWAVPNEWSKITSLKFAFKMYLYNLPAKIKIRKIIRQEGIDIVHVNTTWSYVGAKAALKEKVKLVWHLRESLEEDQNRHIVFKNTGYNLIKKADKVITVSGFVYDKYKEIIGTKLVKVYEGLDETNYYNEKEILVSDIVNILSIGLITEKKGQWQVIEACKILIDKGYTRFQVNIVGRGSKKYIDELKDSVQNYGLENYIKFCGSTADTHSYYRKSDILIMSSMAEAFGRTTVEGMLEGCLVIGAKAGATPELLNYGECGLLYEYGKPEELVAQIIYSLNNIAKVRNIAREGQKYALKSFTAKENAKKIYGQYELLG